MNALYENTLNSITPETLKTYHDLTIMWMHENSQVAGLSPEELYVEYRKVYDRIAAADAGDQNLPGSAHW